MPLRRLLTSGGGGGGGSSFSPMFPLNGVVSCKWDSESNKPDILEIDSEDATKVNLKATDFTIMMNFANGLDDDNRPSALIKTLSANQILNFGASYANRTIQILAKLDNEESDPSIEFRDITSVSGCDYYTDDFIPDMASASQGGFVISGASDAWLIFDNDLNTNCKLGFGGTRYLTVETPYPVSLYKFNFTPSYVEVYLKKIEGYSETLENYVEIWSGSLGNSTGQLTTDVLESENAFNLFSKFRFTYYRGDSSALRVEEAEIIIRPMLKYSKSENKCYVNNGSGFVQGLYVPLGCVVTNASGEVTTLSTYFNTYEFLPVGVSSQ